MSDDKLPNEARILMRNAELATQHLLNELKPNWLDKILAYLKYKKELKFKLELTRHEDDQCFRGLHKGGEWKHVSATTMYKDTSGHGLPLGNRHVFYGKCVRCKAPLVRSLKDYKDS